MAEKLMSMGTIYTSADPETEDLIERIKQIKKELAERLIILGHHYQRDEIIEVSDIRGDSFLLSKRAAEQTKADYIVFCGVHFMAESARILAQPHQRVFLPDMRAGCPMADMADIETVEAVWNELESTIGPNRVLPITYVNSDAEIKAFCGRNGGLTCTSSNADKAFRWAFDRREKIIFFPDEHLGRNTANALDVPRDEVVLWDWLSGEPLAGHSEEELEKARVFLWNGYCHVHTYFTPDHVKRARQSKPGCLVIVHPECPEETVALSDASGSTEQIIQFVKKCAPGSVIFIGTEINLVHRLAHEHSDKTILPLARSVCPNMWKISPKNLLHTLEHFSESEEVIIPPDIVRDARLALSRMLEIG
ncbi:MAG: quinolinate synthase NadA [bacterium]